MFAIISPSKTQSFILGKPPVGTTPKFLSEANELAENCKNLSKDDIAKLMSLSDKLSQSTFEKFQSFNNSNTPSKPAILAYSGDVYNSMNPIRYSDADFEFVNQHLGIISGLYGLLKPLDMIQPYRLEMSIKISNSRGKNLYDYWQEKVTDELNNILSSQKTPYLINLASQEYSSVIDHNKLNGEIINITFKENKNGKLQTIGLLAKKARGMMADYIVTQRIDNPNQLKKFNTGGYEYREDLSNPKEWVFIR